MKRRGYTLIQALLALIFGGFIASIVFQQLVTLLVGQQANSDTALSTAQTNSALDTLADHVRGAIPCGNAGAGTVDSVLHAGAVNTFTYYTDTSCTQVRYLLSGNKLQRVEGGVTTTVIRNVSSVTFTYYKADTYNAAWTKTANENAPTTAELPKVCGILMDITTSSNNVTSRFTTTVRLRNAPKKTNLDGL